MRAGARTMPGTSITHHVREAITDLAEVMQSLELTTETIEDALGPLPADADALALRRAAHHAHAAAHQVVDAALALARVGGIFEAMSAVRGAADDPAPADDPAARPRTATPRAARPRTATTHAATAGLERASHETPSRARQRQRPRPRGR